MGKRYSLYCRACEINLTLFEEVGKNFHTQLKNYYCSKCEKIGYQNICIDCKNVLNTIIEIPKNELLVSSSIEDKIKCPHCNNEHTIIAFLGEWN